MRVLLFAHPDFFLDRERALSWSGEFVAELERIGHEVRRFDSATDKIGAFDIVHVFCHEDAETLPSLKNAGVPIVLTPSGDGARAENPGLGARVAGRLLRLSRAALQRKWPPRDEIQFLGSADRILALTPDWEEVAVREWGIPRKKVFLTSENPISAARIADRVYRELDGRKPL